ncbi:hypothetical protein CGCTS75_v009911 [Colletotrichum tropicale]|nr:hypothetical protein CGCTS75_v009911 [Colletotrichum tropicale]
MHRRSSHTPWLLSLGASWISAALLRFDVCRLLLARPTARSSASSLPSLSIPCFSHSPFLSRGQKSARQ